MELLLRELQSTSGIGEFIDRELSGDKITVGCAHDQLIQLLGTDIQARHAVLSKSGSGMRIKTTGSHTVEVNGERTKSATLKVGDTLKVGGHTLVLSEPPSGFDAALELTPDSEVDAASFEHAFQTSLTDTWLSKRIPAWGISLVVLLFGMLIPVVLLFDGNDATPDPESLVFTDAFWSSGPLHPAHNQAIGDECSACHSVPFQRVQDEACTACHSETEDHIPTGHFVTQNMPTERCAVCHVEHNEPSFLIVRADGLCVDCHADPTQLSDGPGHMRAVSGFDMNSHPTFEVAMLKPEIKKAGTGLAFSWSMYETLLEGAQETSNLKYPHDLHLDPDAVQTVNDGRGMQCADCHTLSADNEHFEPISMEAHCQSCHELTFDDSAPQRQLPHGEPIEVVQMMEGHFARTFADPAKKASQQSRRRRPDRSSSSSQCTAGIFECAMQRTRTEVTNQFSVSGCITCHEVDDTGSDDLYTRYQVYPVRLSHDFMPTAKFDHRSHFTQKDAQGDDACLNCHEAKTSSVSNDLLIPGLRNCNQCHSDSNTSDTVPLECISCHQFHPLTAESTNFLERNL
jgi:predicted CXXCH cytochrome family protein